MKKRREMLNRRSPRVRTEKKKERRKEERKRKEKKAGVKLENQLRKRKE
jgi:hypothetical protein